MSLPIPALPVAKPVTKLAPEYPSSSPRRSSRQHLKRTGSGEAAVPSKKAKHPPDQGDNRTGSVVDSLGTNNQAVGENPDGASEALDVLSVSDVIPDDILNQAMDDHDAKTEKHEPRAAVLQAAKSGSSLINIPGKSIRKRNSSSTNSRIAFWPFSKIS